MKKKALYLILVIVFATLLMVGCEENADLPEDEPAVFATPESSQTPTPEPTPTQTPEDILGNATLDSGMFSLNGGHIYIACAFFRTICKWVEALRFRNSLCNLHLRAERLYYMGVNS